MAEDNQDALVGRCFLSLDEDGKARKQGIIKARVDEHRYLIQFFEWLMGEPSTMCVIPVEDLTTRTTSEERAAFSVILFEDSEHLQFFMQYGEGQHLTEHT